MSQAGLVIHVLSVVTIATASELCKLIDALDCQVGKSKIKLSSLSGTLKRMSDAGLLERIENFGPRGGYGYRKRNA